MKTKHLNSASLLHSLFLSSLLPFVITSVRAERTRTTVANPDSSLRDEPLADYNKRMKWFAEAEYGMFVVFGLYSHLAGEWKGEQVPWYGEWLQASKQIPR
jgi:hypothetical protein